MDSKGKLGNTADKKLMHLFGILHKFKKLDWNFTGIEEMTQSSSGSSHTCSYFS